MLEVIPIQRAMIVLDRKPGSGAEDKELKLLNVLATLLVRRNEVAAVAVTKHDDGSGVVQVIACHHVSSDSPLGELTIPQKELESSFSGPSWLPSIHAKTLHTSPMIAQPSSIRRTASCQRFKKLKI